MIVVAGVPGEQSSISVVAANITGRTIIRGVTVIVNASCQPHRGIVQFADEGDIVEQQLQSFGCGWPLHLHK